MITLLKNGHDLDSKSSNNRTPLPWAADNGHEAVVKLLLEKKALSWSPRTNMVEGHSHGLQQTGMRRW
jgi:ankyrin repeat protein